MNENNSAKCQSEKNIKKVLTLGVSCTIIILASRGKREAKQKKFAGKQIPGCGSAWLERLIWDQEVAGSNPVTPTYNLSAGVVQW